MHTYTLALFTFAIPLAVAPAIPLYNFFLLSFPMLVAPIMIVFALTLKSWRGLPWWMSSDPPRTPTKPACVPPSPRPSVPGWAWEKTEKERTDLGVDRTGSTISSRTSARSISATAGNGGSAVKLGESSFLTCPMRPWDPFPVSRALEDS